MIKNIDINVHIFSKTVEKNIFEYSEKIHVNVYFHNDIENTIKQLENCPNVKGIMVLESNPPILTFYIYNSGNIVPTEIEDIIGDNFMHIEFIPESEKYYTMISSKDDLSKDTRYFYLMQLDKYRIVKLNLNISIDDDLVGKWICSRDIIHANHEGLCDISPNISFKSCDNSVYSGEYGEYMKKFIIPGPVSNTINNPLLYHLYDIFMICFSENRGKISSIVLNCNDKHRLLTDENMNRAYSGILG